MVLKKRRTQKNKINRRKQQSKRGGKRTRKNTKNNVRNKRQSRRRRGGAGSSSNGPCIIFGGDINIGYHGDDTYDDGKGGLAKIFLSPKYQLKFKLKVPNITFSETDIIKALTFNVSHYNMNNKEPVVDYQDKPLQATKKKYDESPEAKWINNQQKSWDKTIETINHAIREGHKVFFFQEIDTNLTSGNKNMPGNLGKLLKLFYTNPPTPTSDVLSEPFQSDFEKYSKKGIQQSGGTAKGVVPAPAPVPKVKIISVEDTNFPYYCLKGIVPYKPLLRSGVETNITKAEVITVYHKDLGEPIKANIFNFCGNPTVDDMESEGRPCLVVITSKGYVLINAHFGQPMPFVKKYLNENQDKRGLLPKMKKAYKKVGLKEALRFINGNNSSKWREWFLNQMSDDFSNCFNKSVPGNDIEYELVIAQDGVIENEIKSCCHGDTLKKNDDRRASDYIASNKKVSGLKCFLDEKKEYGKSGSDHEAVTATIHLSEDANRQ
jgi:hypothetical protein